MFIHRTQKGAAILALYPTTTGLAPLRGANIGATEPP